MSTSVGVAVPLVLLPLKVKAPIVFNSGLVTALLAVQVSVAVRLAIPVVDKASKAPKSLARTSVGLPATPSPLVTVIPAAGAVTVLVVAVSVAVRATNP